MARQRACFCKGSGAQQSSRPKCARLQTRLCAVNTQTNSDLQNSWMASGEPECVILVLRWNPQLMSWATKYVKTGEADDAGEDLCLCYVRQEEWPPRDMKARRKTAGPRTGFPFPSSVLEVLSLFRLRFSIFLMDNQQQLSFVLQMRFETHFSLHLIQNKLHLSGGCGGGGEGWFIMSRETDGMSFYPSVAQLFSFM